MQERGFSVELGGDAEGGGAKLLRAKAKETKAVAQAAKAAKTKVRARAAEARRAARAAKAAGGNELMAAMVPAGVPRPAKPERDCLEV